MSIFAETVTKAIADYRYLLRRHLGQVDRMTKLQKLQLKNNEIYKTDLALYKAAMSIVADIEENMLVQNPGYYSYSGIDQFSQFLKEYLNDYLIENDQVVHKARKASRALLQAIQLASLPVERLDEGVAEKLLACNTVILKFGSTEQHNLQLSMLERQQVENPDFYTRIIAHFESVRASEQAERKAA